MYMLFKNKLSLLFFILPACTNYQSIELTKHCELFLDKNNTSWVVLLLRDPDRREMEKGKQKKGKRKNGKSKCSRKKGKWKIGKLACRWAITLQFCCKFTSVSACQKLWKYNAVWQSYCKNRKGAIFLPQAVDAVVWLWVSRHTEDDQSGGDATGERAWKTTSWLGRLNFGDSTRCIDVRLTISGGRRLLQATATQRSSGGHSYYRRLRWIFSRQSRCGSSVHFRYAVVRCPI